MDKAVILDLIKRLVADDRAIAMAAISDAVAAGGTPANIVSANAAIANGDAARALTTTSLR